MCLFSLLGVDYEGVRGKIQQQYLPTAKFTRKTSKWVQIGKYSWKFLKVR